jgi:Alpha-2,8-polysialyltransferase (POLYST)
MSSTDLFLASTAFGLATLAAALDDGHFASAERRVLVVSNNAATPEVTPGLGDVAGIGELLDRFDDVYSYNDLVFPQHPSVWRPRADDLPIWQRQLAQSWRLSADDLRLVVESIAVPPALVLARTFPDARIDVYADGLMSYGPTRNDLPAPVAARLERLLHLDLVPGVRPMLLSEHDVPAILISGEAFTKVVDRLEPAPPLPPAGRRSVAVLLGQYLAAGGLSSDAEETDLHLRMITGAIEAGFRCLVFKPHPSAVGLSTRRLELRARRLGAELHVSLTPALVESWFRSDRIGLVVGSFSTGLATADALYGLPVARVGTERLLRRLRPYENSNRIPLTVIDASVPDLAHCALDADAAPARIAGPHLETLVRAVGYCMQPARYPELRGVAYGLLAGQWRRWRRYLSRARLTELGLPGRIRPKRHPVKQAAYSVLGARRYGRLAERWRCAQTSLRRG